MGYLPQNYKIGLTALFYKKCRQCRYNSSLYFNFFCHIKLLSRVVDQDNCVTSGVTIFMSGNIEANCIILRIVRGSNPLSPYSNCNCVDTADTICFPYSARSLPSTSRLMRSPICQYIKVSSALTLTATRLRVWLIICRRSSNNGIILLFCMVMLSDIR